MPLEAPRLDDRSFNDLMEEAVKKIPLYCPEWTDHNLSDPGITLLELFAWMTDIVLYRLNRVPDKHYVKFMDLLGIRLREAEAARVPVTFWLTQPVSLAQPVNNLIPAFTEVATTRTESSEAIIFSTDREFVIRAPKLQYVLTSRGGQGGGRYFREQPLRQLMDGFEGLSVFRAENDHPEDRPLPDDAFYLGFEEDLSHHILQIDVECVRAKGEGIDPNNPPYVWEVIGAEKDQIWSVAEVDIDETRGLNQDGQIRLHLPSMQQDSRGGKSAYWVRCRLIEPDDGRLYRESPAIRRLRVASRGCTVSATNVVTVFDELLGRSDGSPGQRFELRHTPVVKRDRAEERILVRYEAGGEMHEEEWTEVDDFAASKENDLHYMIDSGTGEVRFGPAMHRRDEDDRYDDGDASKVMCFGAIPRKDAFVVMSKYRYGGGLVGNVAPLTLNVNKSGLPYVERVLNRQRATGGKDAEHLEDAKLRVPGHLRTLDRAVTPADFEYLTEEGAPEQVGRSYCFQSPSQPGLIRLLVIPEVPGLQPGTPIAPESLRLPDHLRDRITAYLDERRLLCTRLEVSQPDYRWVRTEVRMHASGGRRDQERARQQVIRKLYEFINPLTGGMDGKGWPFGRSLRLPDVMAALIAVPGVDRIYSIRLFLVTHDEDGQPIRPGEEREEIAVGMDQVIVSDQHHVVLE